MIAKLSSLSISAAYAFIFLLKASTLSRLTVSPAAIDMRRMRITTVLSCFATVAVISASMYVAYNDVGSSIINGCQFRYVFPLLAPLLFFFRSSRIRLDLKQQRSLSVIFGGMSFNLMFGYLWAYIYKFFIL